MAKPSAQLIAAAAALAVLAGCKMNVTAELYTSDLRQAAVNSESGLFAPGALAIEIPSVDKCAEYSERIGSVVGASIPGFTPRGCERSGMNSYLKADIEIPIIVDNESWASANSLFGVMAYLTSEEVSAEHESVVVLLRLDSSEFRALNSRLNSEFHQQFDLKDSTVSIVVNNDERRDVSIWVDDVFLNGQPVHGLGRTQATMGHRAAAEIVLSNIGTAWMEQNGWVVALLLEHPPL